MPTIFEAPIPQKKSVKPSEKTPIPAHSATMGPLTCFAVNPKGVRFETQQDEEEVILYKNKIGDFAGLLENHEFLSHAFIFMEQHTRPDVWIKNISIDKNNRKLLVAGETDSMEALSRQVAVFEKDEYVGKIDLLSSSLSDSARIGFNLSLVLNPEIFSYAPESQDESDE